MPTKAYKQKKVTVSSYLFPFWVIEGFRTLDPQNHNLML